MHRPSFDLSTMPTGNSISPRLLFHFSNIPSLNIFRVLMEEILSMEVGRDDIITGGDGADEIYGEADNDILYGGNGSDKIHGGRGDDTIYGGEGDDTIRGNEGFDDIFTGAGRDTILGITPSDTVQQ